MKMKKTLLLLFFVLAGIVLGALLASACADSETLGWLAFSREIGISPDAPLLVDISVVRFCFGFSMQFSVAQILTVGAGIGLYNVTKRYV